ncbi:hypothetical protein [Nocardia cyriacigeorgica]|uniref:hypothetical protein n=1 Tax=Nocardia cyriacigeorgica TaxID=135487 RepID=UPI002456A178|nr:hypothetical protein [Nocardia cyriacigeorgica]
MAAGPRAASAPVTAAGLLDTAAPTPTPLDRVRAARWWRGLAAVSRDHAGDGASERILRRFGLVVGLAGVIAALVELPEIADQSRDIALGWTITAVLLAFGMFPALAFVSIGARPRTIRLVSGAAAISFLAAMVVIMLAYSQPTDAVGSVWVYRVLALGVLAAALAWPTVPAIGYLFIGSALSAVVNLFVVPDVSALTSAGDFARAAGLCALFLWCVVYAREAGIRVDRESEVAGRRAAAVGGGGPPRPGPGPAAARGPRPPGRPRRGAPPPATGNAPDSPLSSTMRCCRPCWMPRAAAPNHRCCAVRPNAPWNSSTNRGQAAPIRTIWMRSRRSAFCVRRCTK